MIYGQRKYYCGVINSHCNNKYCSKLAKPFNRIKRSNRMKRSCIKYTDHPDTYLYYCSEHIRVH